MEKVYNPFIIKGKVPAEYFCDRENETKMLISRIRNGHNVVVMSPRRIGKTMLIEHFFDTEEISSNYYTFFVDILHTSSLGEFTYSLGRQIFDTLKPIGSKVLDGFIQTVRSLSAEYGYDAQTGLPKFNFSLGAIRDPQCTLEEIFEYIGKADKRCLVAIDEFQQIANYPEKNVEAILRTHIQHCSNADFIFAGSERHILEEMFNSYSRPFYASSTIMMLDELPLDKYIEFVVRHFAEFGKKISESDVEKVYKLFSGNTYCMQKTFNVAFDMTERKSVCTYGILCNAIDDILLENERMFQGQLSQLTPKPKELLYAIAVDGTAERLTSGEFIRRHRLASASSVQSAIKQLLDNDWITYSSSENGNKTYYLSNKFLMLWIQKNFGQGYKL